MSQRYDIIPYIYRLSHMHHIGCHKWCKSNRHPFQIPTIYEVVHRGGSGSGGGEWPEWLRNVHDVSHSLIVFNSAVNFLLYTFL